MVTTRSSARQGPRPWTHTPTTLTLAWLVVSLVLVSWDTAYILLRPHTMEGGFLHEPLWVPYALYGTVDHVYGWKAWDAGSGFTAAQGSMNLVECVMYVSYLSMWWGGKGEKGEIGGRRGGLALLLGWGAAVMTLSKTVLYCEFWFLGRKMCCMWFC